MRIDKSDWKRDKVGGGRVLDLVLKVKYDEYKVRIYIFCMKREGKDTKCIENNNR